jgi:hypothetical protein
MKIICYYDQKKAQERKTLKRVVRADKTNLFASAVIFGAFYIVIGAAF